MILAYKKKYQTCLQMLDELRVTQPELLNAKLSYNGILDPMAEGVVPVLVGDEENKNRAAITGSEKEYEVGVLIGVSTDSADLLGIVNGWSDDLVNVNTIVGVVESAPSSFEQVVPMHSNRKVRGKRLWWWILKGVEIPEEERPRNRVAIVEREYLNTVSISREALLNEIDLMGKNIGERFRLSKVMESWNQYLAETNLKNYFVLNFRLKVTSGFYVRTFVEGISRQLGIPMVVLSLKRIKIYETNMAEVKRESGADENLPDSRKSD
jgi:tRNA pseudouridine(55) synthase